MTLARNRPAPACHLRVRIEVAQRTALWARAKQQRVSVSQLLRLLIAHELDEDTVDSDTRRDESVIRDAAILIAVEQVLKLLEATIPGGITLSRRLLDSAADAAMARFATAEEALRRQDRE